MSKSNTPSPQTTEVWVRLNLVHRALSRRFELSLRQAGLPSTVWYDILWGLERSPDGMRQFELQQQCLYDQPNLSRILKRMMDEGLVLMERALTDGRGRVFRLTDAGRALRARMWTVYGQMMIDEIEDSLSCEATGHLVEGLRAFDVDLERVLGKVPWDL